MLDPASIAGSIVGQDAVITAIGPSQESDDPQMVVAAAGALIESLRGSGSRG